ncbi:hypothetical protein KIW84_077080 [Lathyrus oleraceus]|uniref:Bicarbonate transporter-like transmembrane domain-containing protein n=1 Tax=Pisum sativum TaxID=3888 RepID=A0A9D5A204_PEA|nr:hypothetical protein KIW84_077080 [Pisum sativum]
MTQDMGKVSPTYIFVALIPALMVAGLYFFDHNVASGLAQQKEFNLKKPSAYHYDIFLLGFMVSIYIHMFLSRYSSILKLITNIIISDFALWTTWLTTFKDEEWSKDESKVREMQDVETLKELYESSMKKNKRLQINIKS